MKKILLVNQSAGYLFGDIAHTICKEAAIYFDPDNAEEIAEKIIELRHDITLQNTMKEKGVAQLSQFGTAEDRAKRILELCKQMIIK